MDKETKKFISEQFKKQRQIFERYVGGLAEHHQDEIDVIGEQYSDIKKAQHEHTSILTANQETLLEHDHLLITILSSVKKIEADLARHSHKISVLEAK